MKQTPPKLSAPRPTSSNPKTALILSLGILTAACQFTDFSFQGVDQPHQQQACPSDQTQLDDTIKQLIMKHDFQKAQGLLGCLPSHPALASTLTSSSASYASSALEQAATLAGTKQSHAALNLLQKTQARVLKQDHPQLSQAMDQITSTEQQLLMEAQIRADLGKSAWLLANWKKTKLRSSSTKKTHLGWHAAKSSKTPAAQTQ